MNMVNAGVSCAFKLFVHALANNHKHTVSINSMLNIIVNIRHYLHFLCRYIEWNGLIWRIAAILRCTIWVCIGCVCVCVYYCVVIARVKEQTFSVDLVQMYSLYFLSYVLYGIVSIYIYILQISLLYRCVFIWWYNRFTNIR